MTTEVSTRVTLRRAVVVALPLVITVGWALYVGAYDQWGRVVDNWRSTLTMIFGSFVAGATPQGGGAVAFPVFTKVLETPTAVARTFSLSIQAVGMVTASLAILLSRKPIDKRTVLVGGGSGVVGFVAGLFLLADVDTAFWESYIPGPYVKVTFTIVLAALAYIVYLALEEENCGIPELPTWNNRMWAGMMTAGLIGGAASALLGSGADVMVFLFIVIVAGLHPRVGVPTSVLSMALVSAAGFLVLGVWHGQLDVAVEAGEVVAVGGQTVGPYPAVRYDLFGMWLAAIPVVVWGAPLGTMFVHALGERRLIAFLAAMAALEVVSTVVFLDSLRTNGWLLAYAIVGLVCGIGIVRWLHSNRGRLLADAAPPDPP